MTAMSPSRHHGFAMWRACGLASGLALCGASSSAAETAASTDQGAIRVLIAPEVETTLISEMAGRISQLNAALGASVAKSALVVALDCSEAQARLQMSDADAVSALETLATKKRLRELEAAGEMEVVLAAAANDRARGAVALARAQAGQCKVEAPFAGRVARIYVKPHQGVGVGTALVDLVSDGPLKLRLNVPSVFLRQLRIGTPFSVVVDETGKAYAAKVSAINSRVDAVAQTVEIEGRFDGSHADLLAGMSGFAQFKTQRRP